MQRGTQYTLQQSRLKMTHIRLHGYLVTCRLQIQYWVIMGIHSPFKNPVTLPASSLTALAVTFLTGTAVVKALLVRIETHQTWTHVVRVRDSLHKEEGLDFVIYDCQIRVSDHPCPL